MCLYNFIFFLSKMATGGQTIKYSGGTCYAMCQDTFSWYNPSISICWRGCDFGTGRVNDAAGRYYFSK